MSLATRLVESDVDFLIATSRQEILNRAMSVIEHAEQMIVIDQSPLARELAQALLLRKHVRPNLKIVVITDPAPEAFGGTPPRDLQSLERAGVIVARVHLDRLRDSNPLYSSVWRMLIGWWSDPFEEVDGNWAASLPAELRRLNFKADQRQVMIADDGSGVWVSLVGGANSDSALSVHGAMAHDILDAELKLATWSTDDDRLPAVPPASGRGVGTIDARFLTESAISDTLVDSLASADRDDQICISVHHLSDRRIIDALLQAAARGAHLRLLLDAVPSPNLGAARELVRGGGSQIELRWANAAAAREGGARLPRNPLALIRHRSDLSIYFGSANFTRRNLADLNLEAAMELRMPAKTALAHNVSDYFARRWSQGAAYGLYSDESAVTYWRYRIAEATGLASF
jgi:hypothetical protein